MAIDFKINQLRVGQLIGEDAGELGRMVIYTNRTSGSSLNSGTITDTLFANEANGEDVSIAISGSKFAVGRDIYDGLGVEQPNTGIILLAGDTVVSGAFVANSRVPGRFLAVSSSLVGVDGFLTNNDSHLISNSFIAASRNVGIYGFEAPPQPSGFRGFHTVLGSYGMEITSSNHVAAINAVNYVADTSSRNVVTRSFGVTLIGTALQNVNGGRNVIVLNDYSGSNQDDQHLFAANNISTNTSDNYLLSSIGNYQCEITGGFACTHFANFQSTIIGGTNSCVMQTSNGTFVGNNFGFFVGASSADISNTNNVGVFRSSDANILDVSNVVSLADNQVQVENTSNIVTIGNQDIYVTNSVGTNQLSMFIGNSDASIQNSTDDFIVSSRSITAFNIQRCRVIGNTTGSLVDSNDVYSLGYNLGLASSSNVFILGKNWQLTGQTNLLALGSQTAAIRTVISSSVGVDFATGSVNFNNGLSYKPYIVTGSSNQLLRDTYLVGVSASGSPSISVVLPATASFGQTYVIKDIRGNASGSNIIVSDVGGTIDNSSTYTLAVNFASVTLCLFTKSAAGLNLWGVI